VGGTRLIGLGNSILSDDGAGIYAVREVARRLTAAGRNGVDIVESEVAGFDLMELMAGWERILLVDSIQFDGVEPGTVLRLDARNLRTSLRLRSVHEIDLPTVLDLGRCMGLAMPRDVQIFGIQVEDVLTLGERLTDAAAAGVRRAVDQILQEL
jgi:hydrogenase maturation protease